MLVIGTHLRMVSRYYMQVTPLIVFFVAMLLLDVVGWLGRLIARRPLPLRRPTLVALLAAAPFLWLAVYPRHGPARRVDAAQPTTTPAPCSADRDRSRTRPPWTLIEKYTRPDDIVVYYRARTATLYTGRRPCRPTSFEQHGGQRRLVHAEQEGQLLAGRWRPPSSSSAAGFELVWEDDNWRLWRIPDEAVEATDHRTPSSADPHAVLPAVPSLPRR